MERNEAIMRDEESVQSEYAESNQLGDVLLNNEDSDDQESEDAIMDDRENEIYWMDGVER
jgi:hypothetical protein